MSNTKPKPVPKAVLTPADLPPKIVTLPELTRVVSPYIMGYAWASDVLGDLWQRGAPMPNSVPCKCTDIRFCTHQRRILLPTRFAEWWEDVKARMGNSMTTEQAYGLFR